MIFSKSFGYAVRGVLYIALMQDEKRYVQVEEIASTLSVPRHFSGESKVEIEILPNNNGSVLTLVPTGVPKDLTEESWKKMLGQLKLTLENQ